jgi:hypothetical protein
VTNLLLFCDNNCDRIDYLYETAERRGQSLGAFIKKRQGRGRLPL